MKSASELRAEWRAAMHSTTPVDRPSAEAAIRALYSAASFSPPRSIVWFDSPFAASWAVAAITARHNAMWSQTLGSELRQDERQRLDDAKESLGGQLGVADWNAVLAAAGKPSSMHLLFPSVGGPSFQMPIVEARYGLSDDVSALFKVHGDEDDLQRAEDRFWGGNRGALRSALHCPVTDPIIGHSFYEDYSFSTMADDQHRIGDREPPPILRAAWDVARSVGMWWPLEHMAIVSDRPAELHLNDRLLLERGDGPAVVYRDDWRVYAWNGMALPAAYIEHPESIPPRELKHLDAGFRKYVESRVGKPASKPKQRAKAQSIIKSPLPSDPDERLEKLRAYAGGTLPLYERYVAGEHEKVWSELIALGPAARDDPNAADALAVAYETMRRVDSNVRTLARRLEQMGYKFTTKSRGSAAQPGGLFGMVSKMLLGGQGPKPKQQAPASTVGHTPPDANARESIAGYEKEVGTLPLSVRAFYEVVGAVDFMGQHPTLAPRSGSIAPDPLVVYGLDDAFSGAFEDEDEDGPRAIVIAPDDLHKADTSGGDPYEIAVDDLRADGEVLNERHRMFFVAYLRLCFEYGGFPGYEGTSSIPGEIETLKAGLLKI